MHVQLEEAAKRLEIAKDTYVAAVGSIVRQYLKPVIAAGDPADIEAARDLLATADELDFTPLIAAHRRAMGRIEELTNQAGETVSGDQEVPGSAPVSPANTVNDPSDASGTSSPQE